MCIVSSPVWLTYSYFKTIFQVQFYQQKGLRALGDPSNECAVSSPVSLMSGYFKTIFKVKLNCHRLPEQWICRVSSPSGTDNWPFLDSSNTKNSVLEDLNSECTESLHLVSPKEWPAASWCLSFQDHECVLCPWRPQQWICTVSTQVSPKMAIPSAKKNSNKSKC